MTITSAGAFCDVCDNYILPVMPDEMVNTFSIFGYDGLHCHNGCKERLLALDHSLPEFWKELPEGRVRRVADEIAAREELEAIAKATGDAS